MITFHKIIYKNFLAAGNNPIEIDLNRNKSTLIVGHNGAGKSTILDALSFGLFGKPHRSVSKTQLVNSVNGKGAEVEVVFTIGNHAFKIIRGIKPNVFEIWQDGEMLDQSANVRDYQKFLEQNILKLNHKSFHQIVVLGSSSFVPFMQLPPQHRREVIEDLLDINIFSKMKNILKERSISTKDQYKETKAELDIYKGKYEYQSKYITKMEALNKKAEANFDEENAKIQDEVDACNAEGLVLHTKALEYPQDLKGDLSKLNDIKLDIVSKLSELKKSIKDSTEEYFFYMNNDSCPTCSQDISQTLKDDRVTSLKASSKELVTTQDKLNSDKQDNTDAMAKLQADIDGYSKLISDMKQLQHKKEMLTKSKKTKVSSVDLTDSYVEAKELLTAADECRDLLDELNNKALYQGIATEMLKDSGIRTKVVKEYLPEMNMLINQYLQTLDFFVSFNLDENFNEIIRSRHRDTFVYANFSEGEKQRIDLSLLFAWRQIAKMKNSTNTNLLILDETFDSSLDTDGVDNLMKILYALDSNTNTFVISHKPDLLESKLDSKITFKKINNFSAIT